MKSAHTPATRKTVGEIRIIGGTHRSRRLPVLLAEGLRPSSDRVRETVFNWLQHLWGNDWSDKHVLDAFAGSGALGFEAASRGAGSVILVEKNKAIAAQLTANRDKLAATQCRVLAQDALAALATLGHQKMDLIFLDPPFKQNLLKACLPLVLTSLASDGYVYIESEAALDYACLENLVMVREGKTAQVRFGLYQKAAE